MKRIIIGLTLILTGCSSGPSTAPISPSTIVEVPTPITRSARKQVPYSPKIDHACARYVRARIKHPKADPSAAAAGDAFCADVPLHASKSLKNDQRWLMALTQRIENERGATQR
jgi:hypothetical protein